MWLTGKKQTENLEPTSQRTTMKFNFFLGLLVLTANVLAAPSAVKDPEKRNPTGSFSLVAFGIASSYIDIFYSDGLPHSSSLFMTIRFNPGL